MLEAEERIEASQANVFICERGSPSHAANILGRKVGVVKSKCQPHKRLFVCWAQEIEPECRQLNQPTAGPHSDLSPSNNVPVWPKRRIQVPLIFRPVENWHGYMRQWAEGAENNEEISQ
ncbi:hypothetical protein AYI68_g3577 [Smittium mucronatum]|uniref:Uncharacterized protein n=1 Tax=Smittium mucronatum TaxID=133383 RepID=A0A1R0GZR1_9FUNG|nr:hypothetical protein AYI68_g3577 [Smittium mucronatum]